MSRTRHAKFKLRRYILREWDFDRYLRRRYALDLRSIDHAVDEYEDTPDGDYVLAAPLHEAQARAVHHRGRRLRAQTRRRRKQMRTRQRAIVERLNAWRFVETPMRLTDSDFTTWWLKENESETDDSSCR